MAAYHFHCMYLQWLISFQILLPKPYPSIEIPSFPNYIRYINIKVNSITLPDMNMEKTEKLFSSQIAGTKDTGVGYLGHCRLPASVKISNQRRTGAPTWNCYLQKCSNSVPCVILKICIAF